MGGTAAITAIAFGAYRDLKYKTDKVDRTQPFSTAFKLAVFGSVAVVPFFTYGRAARGSSPFLLHTTFCCSAWLLSLVDRIDGKDQKLALLYVGQLFSFALFALALVLVDNVFCEDLRAISPTFPWHSILSHSTVLPHG